MGLPRKCPLCERERLRLWYQEESFSLYRCGYCFSNVSDRSGPVMKPYDESYFGDNHEKAYGKSYLSDQVNIRGYSRRRLMEIRRRVTSPTPRLLDVGSALGFFLDEARVLGFRPEGVEISEYARNFCEKEFSIPVYADISSVQGLYDVITLWFTLEHMAAPEGFLKEVSALLAPGGMIALGLPNGNGAFSRFNPKAYFRARPSEHEFEPSPKGLRLLLSRLGFEVVHFEYFGLHPARLGLPENPFWMELQKKCKLGDTFECYAVKV